MLNPSGEEEESESDSNNNNIMNDNNNYNKDENQIKTDNNNNKLINKKISKKISSNSDNFFHNDSNDYEIISKQKKNESKEDLNNKNQESEKDSAEELNFTDVDNDDNQDDHQNDDNDNDKESENQIVKKTKINSNLNKTNNNENKDNNNSNNDSDNNLNNNKDNNSELDNEEIESEKKSNSIKSDVNNSINKEENEIKEDEGNNNKIINNNENKENNITSSENSNDQVNPLNSPTNKIMKSINYNDGWSYSVENRGTSLAHKKDSNIINNNIDNTKKEEDLNNSIDDKNNNDNKKISNNIENNNINNEDENNKSIDEGEENNDDYLNNNPIYQYTKKNTLKFSKDDISSIKDNISSNNKEKNSQDELSSFLSKSNSDIKQNNKNEIKNINNNNESKEKIKINETKKVEFKNIKNESKQNNENNIKNTDSIYEIKYVKDEYYIKYIKLKRKGFDNIIEKNYVQGYNNFSECYELSCKYLKDKIKQIDSLINMSICQYYNGNFNDCVSLLNNGKKIFATVSLGESHISPGDKMRLGIKLYTYSSMSNLSVNNYNESINDIKYLINLIEQENDFDKKVSFFKYILYTLFKVETLLNIKNENEIITNINNNFNYNLSDKNLTNLNNTKESENFNNNINNQNERMINDFLACLKHKNYLIILNSFIENASIYKKDKNMTGYYFCIFNQYLITYNNEININKEKPEDNINKEEQIKDMKERLYICYKNLLGEEISSNLKGKKINKDIEQFLKEFNGKMECSFEIFSLLENYEKTLNKGTQNLYIEKKDTKYLINNKYKAKLKDNKESPYIAILCLKYSLNYIRKKKESLMNDKTNESKESIDNINALIKELEILLNKIKKYEIDISAIKKKNINQDIIKNINILLENIVYIYYKSLLYKNFHKLRKKALNTKITENYENIEKFLSDNFDIIRKGMNLTKINYRTKGHKIYFYSIDSDSNTLNIREIGNDPYPNSSYSLIKDVTKITYGIRSKNLIKILKDKNEGDPETRKYIRAPWKFISFILKKKSIDLYCETEQVDNLFYGLKDFFTIDNSLNYKIMSTNKFVLNKMKYRIAIQLKVANDNGDIKEEQSQILIKKLIKEKAFHNISFCKLMLLYNKLIKD